MTHSFFPAGAESPPPIRLGVLNSIPCPNIIDMIAQCGHDFVVIDTEHVLIDDNTLRDCIHACRHHHCMPLVRVAEIRPHWIGKIMDAGAMGIVLSRAESVDQIHAIAQAMKFPPLGQRGITGGTVTGYGNLGLDEYIARSNARTLLVPMIESKAGLEALVGMLQTGLASLVMEGALDLALDLGLGPQALHPRVFEALNRIHRACVQAGTPFCPNPRTPEQIQHWLGLGCTFYLCGEDRSHFAKTLRNNLQSFRGA